MKIQLVGGSGFIGTSLREKLSSYEILNIDKITSSEYPKTDIADIRDEIALGKYIAPVDWLILLAAEHRDDVSPVSLYYDVNVAGTKNIIRQLEEKNINRIIFLSSVAVYGLNKNNPNEEFAIDPATDYGKSKFEAEELLRVWHQKDPANRTLIIIRPTVVFGPKNRGNVYNLFKQIASGRFLMIGSGKNIKSMAFVENVSGFIQYCIQQNFSGYHLYNYADKPDLTTQELVVNVQKALYGHVNMVRLPYFVGYMAGITFDILAKILNKKLSVSSVRIKKFCATTQFDATKMLKTGYEPRYSLKEGVDITIKSIKDGE